MIKRKRSSRKRIPFGAIFFYLLYFAGIGACCYGIWVGLNWLEGWLTNYEASQPDVKSAQVFTERFETPDWAALYTELGFTDTHFESAEHYRRYMEEKTAGAQISYYETSAGLSGDHKYIVTANGEKLATFTLTDVAREEGMIRDWQYAGAEIFFQRRHSVWVCADQGVTVSINGVALDESYVMKTLQTGAEGYLPEGEHGLRRQWLYVDGLLVPPEVTAQNALGEAVTLTYLPETNLYLQETPEMTISAEESNAVVEAAQVYCRFMIGAASSQTMPLYFDREMDNYSTILYSKKWMQRYQGYSFSQPEFNSFYRYSDSRFSVRLTMSLNVKRNSGTVKEYPLDTTFFLEKREDNRWMVYHMTNMDVQEQTVLVRLRYTVDGQILDEQMVNASTTTLTPPAVDIPQGKVFLGWYLLQNDENGNPSYSLAFLPGEDGTVSLSGETALEPMMLYALFEDKEAD